MDNISNPSKLINEKNVQDARIYRSDIVKNHREISKSLSRKRRDKGELSTRRRNQTATLDWINVVSLVLFQTYLGTQTKKTSAKWLAKDLNRLRSPDEKQLTEKTAGNKLRTLKKTFINGRAVIDVTSPRGISKHTDYYTLGTHITVVDIEGLLTLYAVLWSLYYSGFDSFIDENVLAHKVRQRIIEDIQKSGAELSQTHVDIIGNWSLDSMFEWTKMGRHVDIIGKDCGHKWELYTITPQLHSITTNIPDSQSSPGNLFENEEEVKQEEVKKPEPYRNPRIKYDNYIEGSASTIKNPFVDLKVLHKPLYKWEEDEPVNPVAQEDVDPDILKAVKWAMIQNDDGLEPLKCDPDAYKFASVEIARDAESIAKKGTGPSRREVYALATYATRQYIKKSKEYGYNVKPKYYNTHATNNF